MLDNPGAEALMQDARDAYAKAEDLMVAGDWRDGAEKGWLAVRNATAALIWDVTGIDNPTSSHITAGLRKLAQDRGGQWVTLRKAYSDAVHLLHSQAFYDGVHNADLPQLVREVAGYIALAEELAGNDA